jgi:hypothetical protein
MTDKSEAVGQEMSECGIAQLIKGQIDRTYDAARMLQAWEKILSGPTSPKVIARALVMVLSSGDYVRRVKPVAPVVNIYLSGSGNSPELATELADAIRSTSR